MLVPLLQLVSLLADALSRPMKKKAATYCMVHKLNRDPFHPVVYGTDVVRDPTARVH